MSYGKRITVKEFRYENRGTAGADYSDLKVKFLKALDSSSSSGVSFRINNSGTSVFLSEEQILDLTKELLGFIKEHVKSNVPKIKQG